MRKKILIVDDSATTRTQLLLVLKGLEVDVIEAEHGDDGLAKLASHPDVALVISDVNMPWKDGFEMLAEVRASEATKDIPFIMLTTEGSPDEIRKAKQLGIKAWLLKPFKPEALLQVVTKILA